MPIDTLTASLPVTHYNPEHVATWEADYTTGHGHPLDAYDGEDTQRAVTKWIAGHDNMRQITRPNRLGQILVASGVLEVGIYLVRHSAKGPWAVRVESKGWVNPEDPPQMPPLEEPSEEPSEAPCQPANSAARAAWVAGLCGGDWVAVCDSSGSRIPAVIILTRGTRYVMGRAFHTYGAIAPHPNEKKRGLTTWIEPLPQKALDDIDYRKTLATLQDAIIRKTLRVETLRALLAIIEVAS